MEFKQESLKLDWMAINVERDQAASVLGLHCMSQYLGSLRYCILAWIDR